MKYKVEHLQSDTYQVSGYATIDQWDDDEEATIYFQGSLSDCESYIRLKQNENVDF